MATETDSVWPEMSSAVVASSLSPEAAEKFSLYLALRPGTKPDLEAVARASLAFASAMRELAFVIDPSLDLRIELLSGTESSLSLNSLLHSLGKDPEKAKLRLKAIILACTVYFGMSLTDWTFQKIFDYLYDLYSESKTDDKLNKDEIQKIIEQAAEAAAKRVAAPDIQKVYRELKNDTAISGVGIIVGNSERPRDLVPSNEFEERASPTVPVEDEEQRTRDEVVTLTLISPVLESETRRQWRFRGPSSDFSAYMKDMDFLDKLLEGRSSITMRSGIRLEVELRIVEEKRAGVWRITERSILQVRQVRPPVQQQSLDLDPRP